MLWRASKSAQAESEWARSDPYAGNSLWRLGWKVTERFVEIASAVVETVNMLVPELRYPRVLSLFEQRLELFFGKRGSCSVASARKRASRPRR
jgi:hypothetical protein